MWSSSSSSEDEQVETVPRKHWIDILRESDEQYGQMGNTAVKRVEPPAVEMKRIRRKRVKASTIIAINEDNAPGRPPIKRTRTHHQYFRMLEHEQNTLPAILARLTAMEGISFNVLATSSVLRKGISDMGFPELSKSPIALCQLVLDYSDTIRDLLYKELDKRCISDYESGGKFSLSCDEWISMRNQHYMHLTLSSQDEKLWSLGLIRVDDEMHNERLINMLENKVNYYGLDMKNDIVAITAADSNFLNRIECLISPRFQLCFAHGLQLAIMDVLYQNPQIQQDFETDDDLDEDGDFYDEGLIEIVDNTEPCEVTNEIVAPVINKVRKIITLFKKSKTSNHYNTLQKYVFGIFGRELDLILDDKTTWIGLLVMLARFYGLSDCVKKAQIEMKTDPSLELTDNDIQIICDLVKSLTAVKMTMEIISKQGANLLTADNNIDWLLKQLSGQLSGFSTQLRAALLFRLAPRRSDLSGLMQYLSTGNHNDESEFSKVPGRVALFKLLIDLLERLKATSTTKLEKRIAEIKGPELNPPPVYREYYDIDDTNTTESLISVSSETSIDEEQLVLSKMDFSPKIFNIRDKPMYTLIEKEMCHLEKKGKRGPYLDRVFHFLMSIQPTSIHACQQLCSTNGVNKTKINSRLSDDVLDELCFMRAYFLSEN